MNKVVRKLFSLKALNPLPGMPIQMKVFIPIFRSVRAVMQPLNNRIGIYAVINDGEEKDSANS